MTATAHQEEPGRRPASSERSATRRRRRRARAWTSWRTTTTGWKARTTARLGRRSWTTGRPPWSRQVTASTGSPASARWTGTSSPATRGLRRRRRRPTGIRRRCLLGVAGDPPPPCASPRRRRGHCRNSWPPLPPTRAQISAAAHPLAPEFHRRPSAAATNPPGLKSTRIDSSTTNPHPPPKNTPNLPMQTKSSAHKSSNKKTQIKSPSSESPQSTNQIEGIESVGEGESDRQSQKEKN